MHVGTGPILTWCRNNDIEILGLSYIHRASFVLFFSICMKYVYIYMYTYIYIYIHMYIYIYIYTVYSSFGTSEGPTPFRRRTLGGSTDARSFLVLALLLPQLWDLPVNLARGSPGNGHGLGKMEKILVSIIHWLWNQSVSTKPRLYDYYILLHGFGPENVGLIFPMIASHFS